MTRICQELRAAVAADGVGALQRDEARQRHLAECPGCFAYLGSLAEFDAALRGMPSADAPDHLVEALFAQPELVQSGGGTAAAEPPERSRRWWLEMGTGLRRLIRQRPLVWGCLTAGLVVLVLSVSLFLSGQGETLRDQAPDTDGDAAASARRRHAGTYWEDMPGQAGQDMVEELPPSPDPGAGLVGRQRELEFWDRLANLPLVSSVPASDAALRGADRRSSESIANASGGLIVTEEAEPLAPAAEPPLGAGEKSEAREKRGAGERPRGATVEPKTGAPAERRARQFLSDRASVEGLMFKPAKGYWANTYVPGDPMLRLLEARLAGRDLAGLAIHAGISPKLHDASRQTVQPFDPPTATALALYLSADRRGIRERSRVLVQVGLKGTPRRGGRRPPMNLGVVLDLRGNVPTETATGVRALVSALGEARESGDRMRLVVAGRSGGVIAEPDSFRYGYLTITMNRVFAGDARSADPPLGLVEAVRLAIDRVAQADDPDAPLGSSAVILITGQSVGGDLDALAGLAHRSAVAGVPISVVGVGAGVRLEEINRLTLTGQGNRRLLEHPSEAAGLIDRELSAVGRVVARAVRLRIRLAPRVKLVDVLGSSPLDEARAERVREAEKSIDRRLARNLGIEADRGEDEEGVQIVIPSFYANDAHVFLLDVVAPGPGVVADVTVRYKDLVYLRNGVARASLGLGRGEAAAGPLERNVLRNLLALRLSEALEAAGRALGARDIRQAAATLGMFRELLTGLRREVPGLGAERDLAADIAMLGEYESLLGTGITGQPAHLAHLSDSLRYAGLLKVLPRPLTN